MNRSVRRMAAVAAVFAVGLMLLSPASTGQAWADESPPSPTPLAPHAWGLEAQMSGWSGLVQSLGVRYHVSKSSALRLTLSASGSFGVDEEQDTTLTYPGSEISRLRQRGTTRNDHNYSAAFQFLHHTRPDARVGLFYALGPTLGLNWSHHSYTNLDTTSLPQELDGQDYNVHSWSTGLAANVGVEWFLSHKVSLGVQYAMALSYNHTTERDSSYNVTGGSSPSARLDTDTSTGHKWNFSVGGVGLLLTFYP